MKLAESVQGRERYNIMLRYDRPFRETPEQLADILVPTPAGQHIPLGELADDRLDGRPADDPLGKRATDRLGFRRHRRARHRQLCRGSREAVMREKVELPPGYAIAWSGQFEQLMEARERLQLAIPAAVLIILVLLMLHFGRLDRT